jgi:hypothetical protein
VVRPEFHPSLAVNIDAQFPALCHSHDADRLLVLGKNVLEVAKYRVRQIVQVVTGFHIPMPSAREG